MLVGFALEAAKRQGGGTSKKIFALSRGAFAEGGFCSTGVHLIKGFSTPYMGVFSEVEHLLRNLPNPQGSSSIRGGQRRYSTPCRGAFTSGAEGGGWTCTA
jgi:hypothetical protein